MNDIAENVMQFLMTLRHDLTLLDDSPMMADMAVIIRTR